MARIIKEQEYCRKRSEILDAAQRLLFTKGYERMAVQDILACLKISNGAFYHYFKSKSELLEALIGRMMQEAEQQLLPIFHDIHMSAMEKLQQYFVTLDRMRTKGKAFLLSMMHCWYSDENAIVRQKADEATIVRRTPLIILIVEQGIREGVFAVPYSVQTAEVILSLSLSMGNAFARILLSTEWVYDEARIIENIVAANNAYLEAIERVLGAPSRYLKRLDAGAVREWLEGAEIRKNDN